MIENIIHDAILGYCKHLKRNGAIVGSSAAVASDISFLATVSLLSKQQKKIYDILTVEPMKTGSIAKQCGLSSKMVSAQLIQIYEGSTLISFVQKGRLKLWHKSNKLKL